MLWWLVALASLAAAWGALVILLVLTGRRSAARELAALLPNLVVLFRGLIRDPRVPRGSKILLGVAVVWVISPVDLVPEFIPIAGPLDDAIVAALVLRHVIRRAGKDVLAEHWRGDPATLDKIVRLEGGGVRP